MADTGNKKKGKKQKGKTVPLTAFLSSQAPPGNASSVVYASKTSNWADESEDLPVHGSPSWNDPYGQPQEVQRIILPTAPRAARAGAIDLSQLPKGPPYTAFLGNLPYDVEEEDIYHFFQNVKVKDVRLPRESENGRLKGFGYAEFDDVDVFMRALSLDDETLKGRRIRVDVAGQSQGTDKEKDNKSREVPSEADGDWRTGSKDSGPTLGRQDYRDRNGGEQRRGYGNDAGRDDVDDREWRPPAEPRGGYGERDGYGNRGGGYEERDRYGSRGGGFGDRGRYESRGGGFGDRYGSGDRGGYGDKGGYGDRDGYRNRRGGYDDRDEGGYSERGYGNRQYGDRGRFGDRRGFGDRDGYGSRRDYGSRGAGYGDQDSRYGDRERGYGDRDRGYGDRDRGYGDRDRGYGDRDRGYGDRDRGYGDRDRGYGDRDRGYGDRNRGYGDRDRGYGDRDRGYGGRDRGYGDRDRGYGDRDRGYGDRDRGYGDRDRGYGNRDGRFGNRDGGYGDRERKIGDEDNYEKNDEDWHGDRGSDRTEPSRGPNSQDGDRPSEEDEGTRSGSRESGGRSDDGEREDRPAARERPRLQLQPRSTPKEDNDSNSGNITSSAIFGGAKPVNTAAREMEIAARLEKEKVGKETHENEGKTGDRRRNRSTGSDDGEKKFEKSPPSSIVKRQGERGKSLSDGTTGGRGGLRSDRGRGRGKTGGRGGKRELRPIEPRKYEEPEVKDWAEKNKYSALLETDDDDVDFHSDNQDEDEGEEEVEKEESKDNVLEKDGNSEEVKETS